MKRAQHTPEYEIDLTLPESERWGHVIAAEKKDARALIKEAMAALPAPRNFFKNHS